ncbi:hypothetical protein [Ruegeria sp. HKCCA5491]|uniref:hypothetical protein n=1 Tax=Ruegeria sp. HKCCA5491 TaxID=2682986 RepID=UPI00148A0DA8|nr:hypothetical protein [Ruegeria sp. HKCCA5491]
MTEQPKQNGLNALGNGATSPAGPSLADAMKSAAKALEAGLAKPGRYTAVVSDTSVGERTGPVGWGVVRAALEGVDADEIAMFVPVSHGADALVDDGNGGVTFNPAVFEPRQARAVLGGLNRLHALVTAAGLEADAIASGDDLPMLLGARVSVMVSKGKDRDGLPQNEIAKIIGPAPADADTPAPAPEPVESYDPTDAPF